MFSTSLSLAIRNCRRFSYANVKLFPSTGYRTYSIQSKKSNFLHLHGEHLNWAHKRFYNGILCKKKKCFNIVCNYNVYIKRNLHPIIWIVFRPLLKLTAIFTGRSFRKWWQSLPPDKKRYFSKKFHENSAYIAGGFSVFMIFSYAYYINHLQITPITRRKRFVAFDENQFKQIGELEFKKISMQYERAFLPSNHPYMKRVETVVKKLLKANKDLEEIYDKSWTIAIVNDNTENAFVLPNGEIFVFGGMLKLCSNDDQLGAVLAHEMSHCILGHAAETFSMAHLLDCFMIGLIGIIWAILPSDYLALLTHWLTNVLVDIMLQLPYNRKLETEADEVGMVLAAKACLDVRESSAFWAKMALIQTAFQEIPSIEFLSTHPSHEKRSHHLDRLMNDALNIRLKCGCPPLRRADPRINIETHVKLLDQERRKYRTITIKIP